MNKACNIKALTKLRNGYPNWWCYTHYASARGEGGKQLDKCEKADLPQIAENERIKIDLSLYPGGVGVWGALEPIFDTKRENHPKGVHVHLREKVGAEKVVDNTFREVLIKIPPSNLISQEEWITIDDYIACAYTASVIFDKDLKVVNCSHCGRPHVDADWFSLHPHRKHFCTYCGRDFFDKEESISNPVHHIQSVFNNFPNSRKIVRVDRKLSIKQKDYPGGIQIWGSNPAIIWTASRDEEAGIHVHCFDSKQGPPVLDNTYGVVEIDGIELNFEMVQYYMVQRSISYLQKSTVSLNCPHCSLPHFDRFDKAINPHKIHDCEHCGMVFSESAKLRETISNPVAAAIGLLMKVSPED